MADVKCFLTERTGRARRMLLAYTHDGCPNSNYGHHARTYLDTVEETYDPISMVYNSQRVDLRDDTLPWPTVCSECGADIGDDALRGTSIDSEYRNVETGETYQTWHDIPIGGIQPAPWLDNMYTPQLEHCFNVKCPDGSWWCPDSQVSNCTIPEDHRQEKHHCWVISGTLPDISVTKQGTTCAAGAGSILTPNWHGFLTNGWLRG